MEVLTKFERTIHSWFKNVPHLPDGLRKWLGNNIWWIVAIEAVWEGLMALKNLADISGNMSILSGPMVSYYASAIFATWIIIQESIAFFFALFACILLAFAVKPLRNKQKKGWVLLFATFLLSVIGTVVSAFMTLNPFGFIVSLIFGGLWLSVCAYFLFEIHGEFAHVERSKGVKAKRKTL